MLTPPNVNVYTFNNAVKNDAPSHVRIKRGNKIYLDEDIHSSGIDLRDYLNADEDKVIGKSVSKELTINFIRTEANRNPYQDLQGEFTFEIGIEINGTTEWINQGTFVPYDPDQYADEGVMTLVSHDLMDNFNIPAEGWLNGLTFPMTFNSMFTSLCNYVGGVTADYGDGLLNIKTRSFATNPIANYGVMCRDILEAMAEACGCYARITPDKKCKFVTFTYQSYELLNDDIYEHKYKNYASTIVGLNVKNTEDDIGVMYPSTATTKQQVYVIVDNPFLKTANSTEEDNYIVPLYNRLREHMYNPMDVVCVGNPLIEAGDVISAYRSINDNRSYPMCIYVKETHWDGSLTDHYYSTGRRLRQAYTASVRQKLSEGGRYHIFRNTISELYSELYDPTTGDVSILNQTAQALGFSAAGIDIASSKYVKIRSGGSFLVDATNFKIDSANRIFQTGNWKMDQNELSFNHDIYAIDFAIGRDTVGSDHRMGIDLSYANEIIIFNKYHNSLYDDTPVKVIYGTYIEDDPQYIYGREYYVFKFDGTLGYKNFFIEGAYITDVVTKNIKFQGTKATSNLIRFLDNTADAYGNGVAIGDGGLVVIGAGESAQKIIDMAGLVTAGSEVLYLCSDGNVYIETNMQNSYYDRKEFIFGSNGNLTVPGSVIQGSSRERKHDIKLIEDVSDKIDKLEPVSFIYNNDETKHKRFGLIYEDTVDVLPEICFEDDNHEKGIDYTALVPILLKEIQSLRKRVASLEMKH